MTTDDRVIAILERANPVPPGELVDVPVGATRYLETAQQQRSEPMAIIDPTPTRISDQPPRRRWPLIAVAASVVAIVVASIALVVATRDDTTVVDEPNPTVPPTSPGATVPEAVETLPTTAATPDPAAAQAVVDEFFSAYNAGDTDHVLELLVPDVVLTETYGVGAPAPDSEPEPLSDWARTTAWRNGGWTVVESTCVVAAERRDDGTTISCAYDTVTTLMAAVEADPTPTNALITVVDGAITEFHVAYGIPLFDSVSTPFVGWMNQYRPDATGWSLGDHATREEARRDGQTRAQYASEWSIWLDTWDCAWNGPCTQALDDWVAVYDAECVGLGPDDSLESLDAAMRLVPPSSAKTAEQLQLKVADRALLGSGLTREELAEHQRARLGAMIELGVDERCHPVVE